jgi:hypothetical protein
MPFQVRTIVLSFERYPQVKVAHSRSSISLKFKFRVEMLSKINMLCALDATKRAFIVD